MTGSSSVACGALMRVGRREGWDLGTVTCNAYEATCDACREAVRASGSVMVEWYSDAWDRWADRDRERLQAWGVI